MSVLNSTTSSTRPNLGAGDIGKSYLETDTNKIIVWNGTSWVKWDYDNIYTPTPGYNNDYSILLDGVGDYTQLSSSLSLGTAFSVSCWLKTGTMGTSNYFFFGRLNNFLMYLNGSDKKIKAGHSGGTLSSTTVLANNTWYHVFFARDSSNVCYLYIDGTQEASGTASNTWSLLQIGGDSSYNTSMWLGNIDEAAVWLSDQRSNISTIYPGTEPNSLASITPDHWWRMGEDDGGSGSTITDVGYNTSLKDLTLYNGTFSTTVPS